MKHVLSYCLLISITMLFAAGGVSFGQDMRVSQTQARQAKAALLEKAAAEKEAAEQEAAASRRQIVEDRTRLEKAVAAEDKALS